MAKEKITGGCQCGAVRYALSGGPYKVYACHCLECQKQSASGFGLSMPVRARDMAIEGETSAYVRPTDSGRKSRCVFCPVCGTRLYHQSDGSPEFVTIKAGSLDDTSRISPVAHLWICRKQPWVILEDTVPAYDTQPDDLKSWRDALIAAASEQA